MKPSRNEIVDLVVNKHPDAGFSLRATSRAGKVLAGQDIEEGKSWLAAMVCLNTCLGRVWRSGSGATVRVDPNSIEVLRMAVGNGYMRWSIVERFDRDEAGNYLITDRIKIQNIAPFGATPSRPDLRLAL